MLVGVQEMLFRNNVHTAIKHPASAETTLISNTWFHVAINTHVFIRQSSLNFCSESLVSVEVSQSQAGSREGEDTKLWLIGKEVVVEYQDTIKNNLML